MKIVDVVYLDQNGICEDGIRYFDDNGGLPDGNYNENNLKGSWIVIDGDATNYNVTYAYRTIDDTTLIPTTELAEIIDIPDAGHEKEEVKLNAKNTHIAELELWHKHGTNRSLHIGDIRVVFLKIEDYDNFDEIQEAVNTTIKEFEK